MRSTPRPGRAPALAWGAGLAAAAGTAGAAMAILTPAIGLLILAVVVAAVTVATGNGRAVTFALMCLAALFVPLIGLRIAPSLTVGDGLIIAALLFALLFRNSGRPASREFFFLVFWAIAAIAVGGLLGLIWNGIGSEGLSELFRFSVSAFSVIAVFWLMIPTRAQLRVMGGFFAAGVVWSACVSFTQDVPRPAGLSLHSNHLAISGVLAVAMLVAIILDAVPPIARVLAGAAAIVIVAALLNSGSRAGLIGIGAAVVIILLATRSVSLVLAIGAGMAVLAYAVGSGDSGLISSQAIDRLTMSDPTAAQSDSSRELLLHGEWTQIASSPFVGTGFSGAREAHSLYLQVWGAAGLLGLIGAAVLATASWIGVRRASGRKDWPALCLWAGYCGYLVAGVVSNQIWDRYLWWALCMAVAATEGSRLGAARWRRARRAGTAPTGPRSTVPVGV